MVRRVLGFGLVVFGALFGERWSGCGVVWGWPGAVQTFAFALRFDFDCYFLFRLWSPGGFWEAVGGVDRVAVEIYDWAGVLGVWISVGGIRP